MLEKLGLPAKPSIRGAAWVIDASHCQGCSSQFTFINRKHHCRRCGGLFCNSCTQQRMILRGQGDSPVRICDPCKKLEEASRFELRYGHKNRSVKGNAKHVSKAEEEVLGQILGTDGKQPVLSGRENVFSDLQKTASSASSSSLKEESSTPGREVDILRSLSVGTDSDALNDIGSSSPEELRQQAVEEKKKYRILKGEGKSEEALQAFKRGKELERQAGALEIAVRKSRRMASKASNVSNLADTQKTDDSEEFNSKKLPSRMGKEGKDDLAAELKELGWSDADLHDADKNPAKRTLEGELSNLLGEMPKKSSLGKGTGGIDKTQVIAHKKKALMLKREGKLAEAKEELKRAKILEKQLEEHELLGETEDSDDELSALIRSMDDDKQDDLLLGHAPDPVANFDHLLGVANDVAIDGNFEVTDDDMNDPELAAALKSFGWSDEDDEHAADHVLHPARLGLEALQGEVLALKREALSQKRAGNVAEAMTLLKKAKLLEKDLESMQSDAQASTPEIMQKTSTPHLSGEPSVARTADEENVMEMKCSNIKSPPKSKLMVQKELLSLKKKALTLRREGRVEEAEEELKKGKVLEQQLEEMENAPNKPAAKVVRKVLEPAHLHEDDPGILDLRDGVEADVTEQDMHDPALLSVLKNLGWNDDDNIESSSMTNKTYKQMNQQAAHDSVPSVAPRKAMRSKAEIQKELLGLKRKALALRRRGKTQEAEEELERAKALENEMTEIENANSMAMESHGFGSLIPLEKSDSQKAATDIQNTDSSVLTSRIPKDEEVATPQMPDINLKRSVMTDPPSSGSSISVHETLGFEPGSLGELGRRSEGGPKENVSIFPQSVQSSNMLDFLSGSEDLVQKQNSYANILSPANVSIQSAIRVSAEANTSSEHEIFSHVTSSTQMVDKPETKVTTTSQTEISERNSAHGFDAQRAEILTRKRKALALKREGKLAEAREELRQAKLLEKSLEDAQQADVGTENASASTSDNSYITQEGRTNQASKPVPGGSSLMQEGRTNQAQKPVSGRDRFKLQQESLSHKRNALKLRREGKIAESETEFELAKALESQLEEFGTQGSSANAHIGKAEAMEDAGVEDLLDPQLMSALKSIGWGDADIAIQPSKKSEPRPSTEKGGNPRAEKSQLEEQIKAEKLRALNLKRAGKQAEALEALRSAKRYEKQLGLLPS